MRQACVDVDYGDVVPLILAHYYLVEKGIVLGRPLLL